MQSPSTGPQGCSPLVDYPSPSLQPRVLLLDLLFLIVEIPKYFFDKEMTG